MRRGYPILAEEVATLFSLDECGICVNEVESSVLPKKAGGPGSLRRLFNQALVRAARAARVLPPVFVVSMSGSLDGLSSRFAAAR